MASPIIIHLLSRRRFRIVEWAAIDFLLEADKKNRRRVRLEHLILLILRCLAILLLAMATARLFVEPSGAAARALAAEARFERIVLLDDTLSMGQRVGNSSLFDRAKEGIRRFAERLAEDGGGDTMTLILASRPDKPVFAGQYPRGAMLAEILRLVDGCELSDASGKLAEAVAALERRIGSGGGSGGGGGGRVNRAVYIVSDFRARDWGTGTPAANGPAGAKPSSEAALPSAVSRIAKGVQALVLADVSVEETANLSLLSLEIAEGRHAVENVPARFVATVANRGKEEAAEVPVEFFVGDLQPQRVTIASLPPGGTAAAEFNFTFRERGPAAVRAELPPDRLPGDNRRYLAIKVTEGVPILLVNGEPSADPLEDETTYIERAINPPGETYSGNKPTVVAENQFEGMNLDAFHAIILCNLYSVSEERADALERFVRAGGGLAIFPGDQTDTAAFNARLFRDGSGLSPLAIEEIRGDETERKWAVPASGEFSHPIFRFFEGAGDSLLGRVKIFRYFASKPAEAAPGTASKSAATAPGAAPKSNDAATPSAGEARVVVRLSDPDGSPLMAERNFGKGRVVVFTTSCDREWTAWPNDPSYAVTILELTKYIGRPWAGEWNHRVGDAISVPIDPAKYGLDATLRTPRFPDDPDHRLRAGEREEGGKLEVSFADTNKAGFYRLTLAERDGDPETIPIAVNVDPEEGRLERIAPEELNRMLPGVEFRYVKGAGDMGLSPFEGTRIEIWKLLLAAAMATLAAEQLLAWLFGRSR